MIIFGNCAQSRGVVFTFSHVAVCQHVPYMHRILPLQKNNKETSLYCLPEGDSFPNRANPCFVFQIKQRTKTGSPEVEKKRD